MFSSSIKKDNILGLIRVEVMLGKVSRGWRDSWDLGCIKGND
jgi:hypothetical protein